jgi:hypothetical protein
MIKRWNFQELWKRKSQIIEGYFNKYINFWNRRKIKKISKERIQICRKNICGFYDKDGTSEAAYVKGKESCGGCGCVLEEKTSCMSCGCYLLEINLKPLWEAVENES